MKGSLQPTHRPRSHSSLLLLLGLLLLLLLLIPLPARGLEYDLPGKGTVQAELLRIDDQSATFRLQDGSNLTVDAAEFRSGYYQFLQMRHRMTQGEAPGEDPALQPEPTRSPEPDQPTAPAFQRWNLTPEAARGVGRDHLQARVLEIAAGQVKLETSQGRVGTLPLTALAPEHQADLLEWFLQNLAPNQAYFRVESRLITRDLPPVEAEVLPAGRPAAPRDKEDAEEQEKPADPERLVRIDSPQPVAEPGEDRSPEQGLAGKPPEGQVQDLQYGWVELQFLSRAPLPLPEVRMEVYPVKKRKNPGADQYLTGQMLWQEPEPVTDRGTLFRTPSVPLYETHVKANPKEFEPARDYEETLNGVVARVYSGDRLIHVHVEPEALYTVTEWLGPSPLASPEDAVRPWQQDVQKLRRMLQEQGLTGGQTTPGNPPDDTASEQPQEPDKGSPAP